MKLKCCYLPICRGCPNGMLDFEQQKTDKKTLFLNRISSCFSSKFLPKVQFDFIFPVFDHYRIRSDFTYQEGKIGWYDNDQNFLVIENCSLHTSQLTAFVQQISNFKLPIRKGSIRFRVSKDNLKGVWFDFSNQDIKAMLSTATVLDPFFESGIIVEMGQKGKCAQKKGLEYKLSVPRPAYWFETLYKNESVPLNALISSFTQTNSELNVKMIQIIKKIIGDRVYGNVIEFGCGIGNFTLMLTEISDSVIVIENDFRNLIPLKANLEKYGISSKVEIYETLNSFLRLSPIISNKDTLYFLNPSRSGVGALFDRPVEANQVLYVSCYLDSFVKDALKLEMQGFKLIDAILFDQFPHSKHFEIISLFEKN